MKNQIKLTAIALLSTFATSCSMKAKEKAELEKNETVQQVKIEAIEQQQAADEAYAEQAAVEKKKMSGALKGALIGGAAGAATGAVVAKKPIKGAVIGGVIGGTAGAVTGEIIENRNEKKQ
jgi:outer membrane lipoprotein SlyB